MDTLTFPFISLQFSKYAENLRKSGIQVNYQSNDNLYKDIVFLTRQVSFLTLYFTIEYRQWDKFLEFTLFTNSSTKYIFRINPVNGTVFPVNTNTYSIWSNVNGMPAELKEFGDEVMQLLKQMVEFAGRDKLILDSNEK